MSKQTKRISPSGLSQKFVRSREVILQLTLWRNRLERYHECRQRVNWRTTPPRLRSPVEKQRRKESWRCAADVLECERLLMLWMAEDTKNPEIYSAIDEHHDSTLRQLQRRHHQNVRTMRYFTGDERTRHTEQRAETIFAIRTIYRKWMVMLFEAVFPGENIPWPMLLHKTELWPRKIRQTQREMKEAFEKEQWNRRQSDAAD